MIQDDQARGEPAPSAVRDQDQARDSGVAVLAGEQGADTGSVIETVVCPFHCLYQDALSFHTQSRLARSESEASRIARAALLLYVSSAEALVHQAALELGRAELRGMLVDPDRPISLFEAWRVLPAIAAEPGTYGTPVRSRGAPVAAVRRAALAQKLVGLPGPARRASAFTDRTAATAITNHCKPHEVPEGLRQAAVTSRLAFPRTGLPRDPYALRPHHLDAARGILDAAIEALDRRMAGALTRGQRHRREPVRVVYPPSRQGDL